MVAKLMAGEPVEGVAASPEMSGLIRRVTGEYAYEAMTRQAAVQTVTFLKSQAEAREETGEMPAAPAEGLERVGRGAERKGCRGNE